MGGAPAFDPRASRESRGDGRDPTRCPARFLPDPLHPDRFVCRNFVRAASRRGDALDDAAGSSGGAKASLRVRHVAGRSRHRARHAFGSPLQDPRVNARRVGCRAEAPSRLWPSSASHVAQAGLFHVPSTMPMMAESVSHAHADSRQNVTAEVAFYFKPRRNVAGKGRMPKAGAILAELLHAQHVLSHIRRIPTRTVSACSFAPTLLNPPADPAPGSGPAGLFNHRRPLPASDVLCKARVDCGAFAFTIRLRVTHPTKRRRTTRWRRHSTGVAT